MVVPLTNLLWLVQQHSENTVQVSENSDIVIRQMAEDDVAALVGLHSEVFKGYNATVMGSGYLESLYHTLASHAACVSIVAHEDGKILGWIGGVGNWMSFEKALVRRSLLRAPAILTSILRNSPGLLAKALTVVRRQLRESVRRLRKQIGPPGGATSFAEAASAVRPASLLVIGVAPGRQNQNIGQVMMEDFHRRLSSKDFTTCTLSATCGNEAANRAFQKVGYELSWAQDGLNHYTKHLTKEAIG